MAALLASPLEYDLIRFGLLVLEISSTAPPFGLLLFVMKTVAPKDTSARDIYGAAVLHIGCSILLVNLLIMFPQLAHWLPEL